MRVNVYLDLTGLLLLLLGSPLKYGLHQPCYDVYVLLQVFESFLPSKSFFDLCVHNPVEVVGPHVDRDQFGWETFHDVLGCDEEILMHIER